MDRTYKRNTYLPFLFIAILLNVCGIILFIVEMILKQDLFITIFSFVSFLLMSLPLFFGCYVEKKSKIVIKDDCVQFYFHVSTNPKIKYKNKTGLCIPFNNTKQIYKKLHRGDYILSVDTNFYIIVLNDNTEMKFTLFSFGKKNESEIYKLLDEKINKK